MGRARTGSGKTAAFVLPILQRVLQVSVSHDSPFSHASFFIWYTFEARSVSGAGSRGPLALFVAPSKELATQVHSLLTSLLKPLPFLTLLNLSQLSDKEKSVWETDEPDLVSLSAFHLTDLRTNFLGISISCRSWRPRAS